MADGLVYVFFFSFLLFFFSSFPLFSISVLLSSFYLFLPIFSPVFVVDFSPWNTHDIARSACLFRACVNRRNLFYDKLFFVMSPQIIKRVVMGIQLVFAAHDQLRIDLGVHDRSFWADCHSGPFENYWHYRVGSQNLELYSNCHGHFGQKRLSRDCLNFTLTEEWNTQFRQRNCTVFSLLNSDLFISWNIKSDVIEKKVDCNSKSDNYQGTWNK